MSRSHHPDDDPGLRPTPRRGPAGPYVGAAWRRPRRFARDARLERLLQELSHGFGAQRWWPAETPFEVAVGAVLVQNTAWVGVVRALERLRAADSLRPHALLAHRPDRLAQLVRPAGTYRVKAERLRALSAWYLDVGGLRTLARAPLPSLRAELLGVRGIGPETADAILCFAGGRRAPIASAYARRVLARHGLTAEEVGYDELRAWLARELVPSLLVHQETHALFVRAGASACRPTPRCARCPATAPSAREA